MFASEETRKPADILRQYTYYTLTAFNIRVPMLVKRTLTSLQITQFLIGASYAMAHSFVSYTVPVAVQVNQATAGSGAAVDAAASSGGGLLDGLKGLVFGAGAVGHAAAPSSAGADSSASAAATTVTYKQRVVPCISTTGQTFAIWLNVLYLAPLTYLFVSFFIASYLKRTSAEAKRPRVGGGKAAQRRPSSHLHAAEEAGWDAATGIRREVYGEGRDAEVVVPAAGGKKAASRR